MLSINLALVRRIVPVVGLLGLWGGALPVHAQICTPFTDVAASDGFCSNIQWMYNRGITLGCSAPPGQTWYCPAQFVRRDQMAAFMNRLGNVVFQQGGNAFGATARLGTTDQHSVEIVAGTQTVALYERRLVPNVIASRQLNPRRTAQSYLMVISLSAAHSQRLQLQRVRGRLVLTIVIDQTFEKRREDEIRDQLV